MHRDGWMSSRPALVLLAGVLLGLTGCGGPRVGDGTIGSEWVSFGEPVVLVPERGVCWDGGLTKVDFDLSRLDQVPCTSQHQSETFFVGQFSGDAATQSAPPEVGDSAFVTAFAGCESAAKDFLGGEWQRARVSIVPVAPTERQWSGQARWYRCEMLEVADGDEKVVQRSDSLKDSLLGAAPAALTCANDTGSTVDTVDSVIYVTCSGKHTIEFVGAFTANIKTYPALAAANDAALDACFRLGAGYLGLSDAEMRDRSDVGWIAWTSDDVRSSGGDRTYRCFIGTYDRQRPITGSIRNLGKKPLPR